MRRVRKVQSYLDRVVAGAAEPQFVAEFPHPVLVELEAGQTSDTDAGMMTERLDSHNIRLQSKTSRDANVFEIKATGAAGPTVRVGRATDSHIHVDHGSVSKGHAEFFLEADGIKLMDLGSTNGTFVNNRKLEAQTATKVVADDTVRFGRATGYYLMDAKGFYQYLLTLQRFGL